VRELGASGQQSPAEATNLLLTFDYIKNLNLPNIKRIFKLTGRGHLGEDFDISYYENPDLIGKYVFKTRITSWVHSSVSLFSTRCWSFCYSLLPETYNKMIRIYEGCLRTGFDLEHITYAELDMQKVVEKELLGFRCQVSRTGVVEYD
jgi:hypothetical protein